jgi:hypothetical protein
LAANFGLWRLTFALPAIASRILGPGLACQLPAPPKVRGNARPLAQIGLVVKCPWAILVVLLALVEGGVILGFLTYLPPSLEAAGYGSAVAGLAVGLYGLATLAWTCVLKRASDGLARYALHLIGGVQLAWGYTAGALDRHLAGAVLATVLVAGGFAFMRSESEDQCQALWVIDASEQLGYPSCRSIMRLCRETGRGTIATLLRSDPQELRLSKLHET